jgi:hypothetical protein
LYIERLTDEELTHMLSVQKSPTDKTRQVCSLYF